MADGPSSDVKQKPQKWTGYQYYLIGVLMLVAIVNHADRASIALLQELIKPDLGLSDWQLGLLSGPAFAIFYSLSAFPVARLAERFHRPKILAVAVTFWSGATALSAGAGSFLYLALCRVGVGLGEGGANPISMALVASSFSARQRGLAMSVLSAAGPIGVILAPLIATWVAHAYGWRMAFIALGLPGILIGILLYRTVREPRETASAEQLAKEKPKTFWADTKYLARNASFPFVVAGAVFYGTGTQGIGLFTTSFLLREFDLSLPEVGAIMSFRGGIGLLGVLAGGLIADRFADSRGRIYLLIPAIGGTLAALFYFFAFKQADLLWCVVLISIGFFASDLKSGPLMAAVQNLVPARMRATSTAYFFLGATVFGSILGSMFVGGASDILAGASFSAQYGNYFEVCAGGQAVGNASRALNEACAAASGVGLRGALTIAPLAYLIASVLFYMASRKARIVDE